MTRDVKNWPTPDDMNGLLRDVIDNHLAPIKVRMHEPAALGLVMTEMRNELANRKPWEPSWD